MNIELLVDGETIGLNEFTGKILGGTVVGAVTSLRGIKKDWTEIQIRIRK